MAKFPEKNQQAKESSNTKQILIYDKDEKKNWNKEIVDLKRKSPKEQKLFKTMKVKFVFHIFWLNG